MRDGNQEHIGRAAEPPVVKATSLSERDRGVGGRPGSEASRSESDGGDPRYSRKEVSNE